MTAVVASPLLSDVKPVLPRPRPPVDGIPAWITDPRLIADILAGHTIIHPDLGGAP